LPPLKGKAKVPGAPHFFTQIARKETGICHFSVFQEIKTCKKNNIFIVI
jgi:hypothetical protein